MAIFEVRITRTVVEQHIDLCVRARSHKAASAKALKLMRQQRHPLWTEDCEPQYSTEAQVLDFVPDCEVL